MNYGRPHWVRPVAVLATALCIASALAGCTASRTAETHTPTPSPTDSSTGHGLTPTPVAPPKSARDALEAANTTVNDDEALLFRVLQEKIPGHFYGAFEAGGYRTTMGNTINDDFEDVAQIGADTYAYGGVTGQPRLWIPDAKKSSTTTLAFQGRSYANGVVSLTGCFRDRRVFVYTYSVAPGSPTPTPFPTPETGTEAPMTPTRITVEYQPSKRVWLITGEIALPGSLAAKLCPAGQ